MTNQHLESKIKSKSPDPKERKIPYSSPLSLADEEKGQSQLKDEILKILDGLDKEKIRRKATTLRGEFPAGEIRNEMCQLEDNFQELIADGAQSKEDAKAIFELEIMPYPHLTHMLFDHREEPEEKGILYLHSLFNSPGHSDAILLVLLYQQLIPKDWLRLLQQPTEDDTVRPDSKRAISLHLLAEQPDPSIIISFLSKSVGKEEWEELLFRPNRDGQTALQRYVLKGNLEALKALCNTVSIGTWEKLINYSGVSSKSPLYLALDRVTSLQPSELKTAFQVINYLQATGADRYVRTPETSPSAMELFEIIYAALLAASATYPRAALTARELRNCLWTSVESSLQVILTSQLVTDVMTGNKMPALDCFYSEGEGSTPIDIRELLSNAIETVTTFYPITLRGEFGEGRFFGKDHYDKLSLLRGSYMPLDSYFSEIPRSAITLKLTSTESQELCALFNLIQDINREITARIKTPDSKLDYGFIKVVYCPKQNVPSPATHVALDDGKPITGDSKSPTTQVAFFPLPPSFTSSQSEISATASSSASSTTPSATSKNKRKRVEDSSAPSSPLTNSSPF